MDKPCGECREVKPTNEMVEMTLELYSTNFANYLKGKFEGVSNFNIYFLFIILLFIETFFCISAIGYSYMFTMPWRIG